MSAYDSEKGKYRARGRPLSKKSMNRLFSHAQYMVRYYETMNVNKLNINLKTNTKSGVQFFFG